MASQPTDHQEESATLRVALARIRELHRLAAPIDNRFGPPDWCNECGGDVVWPCPTAEIVEAVDV